MRLNEVLAVILFASPALFAQTVDKPEFVFAGEVRPEVGAGTDLGAVDPETPLKHLVLTLRPSSKAQLALENEIRALHNPSSPSFHHWLSPGEVAARLALPAEGLSSIQNWLASQDLRVDGVALSHSALYFSGRAGKVEAAFHTSIHHIQSPNGEVHMANTTRPLLPSSLATYVSGIAALHDYPPHSNATPVRIIGADTLLTSGNQYVGATDLQVIYQIADVHNSGISGQGQTIAVLETSDMYSVDDWLAYRRAFGLTKKFPQGQLLSR